MFDVHKLCDEAMNRLVAKGVEPYAVAVYPRLITAMCIVQRCGGLDNWDKMTECDKGAAILSVFEDMFWCEGDLTRLEDETDKTVELLQSNDPEQWNTLSVMERSRMCITHMHEFLENSKNYHPDLIDAENFIDVFYRETDFIYSKEADEDYGEIKKYSNMFNEMMKYWDFPLLYAWFQGTRFISFTDYEQAAFWRASEAVCETCKSRIKRLG